MKLLLCLANTKRLFQCCGLLLDMQAINSLPIKVGPPATALSTVSLDEKAGVLELFVQASKSKHAWSERLRISTNVQFPTI
jgi:hypothetical protein